MVRFVPAQQWTGKKEAQSQRIDSAACPAAPVACSLWQKDGQSALVV